MDDLTFTLRTLCLRNRDGSHATQADRLRWWAEKVGKAGVIPADNSQLGHC